jgi:sialate O-acetylesterase
VGAALKDVGAIPASLASTGGDPNRPTVLYNAMISPLEPFAVRGAIWYQGESNADAATQYRTLFPDLIRDWRTHWNAKADGSDFSFYFVQLANYMDRTNEPVQSGWAELRDAQSNTLGVPGTGMASAIDIGDGGNIHPRNKQDVGKRLALNALAKTYGQNVEYSGPTFQSMKVVGNTARIAFTHAGGLKTSDGKAPRTFAIQGEDGKWVAASARIEGDAIVLSGEGVATPTAVRYAWANNPDVNLYNAAGLPANPFRTDAPK